VSRTHAAAPAQYRSNRISWRLQDSAVSVDPKNGKTLSYMEVMVITRGTGLKLGCMAGQKRERHSKGNKQFFFHLN
jgi:hypothetical protein